MNDVMVVTGATGFIGRHLVEALRADGYRVLTHGSGDGDIASCRLDFGRPHHVFHLAGRSFVPDSWTSPLDFYRTNVTGTVNVLESCRRARAPLTFVSSYVYGMPHGLPISERHPLQAFNPYSHSKILAEDAVRYFAKQFDLTTTIVRPFNVYGPGQDERLLVPMLVRQALDPGVDEIRVRDARPKRDFLHVHDLVSLLLATLRRPGGVYNAGSGRSISIGELVGRIRAVTGCEKPLCSTSEERPEEVLDVVADVSLAKDELAWEPTISIDKGLRDTIESMRAKVVGSR